MDIRIQKAHATPLPRVDRNSAGLVGRSHDSALPQCLHSSITKCIQTVRGPSRAANRHCGWETAEQLLEVGLRTAALAPAPFTVAVLYLISSDVTRKRTVTKWANNDHMTRCRKKESPQEEVQLSLHQENSTPQLGPCSHASYKKKGS